MISDRALTMYDPQPRFPWTGNAWESSRYAQAAMPVAPHVCLLMTPGTERFLVRQASQKEVEAINLRSYGWAEQSIFGSSEEVLKDVCKAATASPESVPKPRLPATVVVKRMDENDGQIGADNVARGWPRRLALSRPDGTREFLSYELVEIDPTGGTVPLVLPDVITALKAAFDTPKQ